MFISSVVTFKSLDDLNLFWEVWPINWFYAILIAFPAIMIFRPICQKISEMDNHCFIFAKITFKYEQDNLTLDFAD